MRKALAFIPDAILRAVGQNTTNRTTIKFQRDGCALNHFFAWIRNNSATTTGDRRLWVSGEGNYTTSHGSTVQFGGAPSFWSAYSVLKCKADLVQSCFESSEDESATIMPTEIETNKSAGSDNTTKPAGSNASAIRSALLSFCVLFLAVTY
ncbi:hypothetical protein BV898_12034 [Hypsibius exemplaris]|uniref:Uncharacterized protein n=1 Tax=Hypsibius exemplaris TaxID=2072580 RepID=A0A1W0WEV5_HYPEX|nr:hypothetical protein BV898_12034 [Hypsibius exemplaris]